MATTETEIVMPVTLDQVEEKLGLHCWFVTTTGPSVTDPCGLGKGWIAFRDKGGNGVYVSVGEGGKISEIGATIHGKRFMLYPEQIVLTNASAI